MWYHSLDYKKLIKEYEFILETLKDVPFNLRKTMLSALVVISSENEKAQKAYRDVMMEDSQKYNAVQKQNKMTDQQKENWIPWSEIEKIVATHKKKYYYLLSEENLSNEDRLNLQKYVMLCCYTMIPPRRALDFMTMKIKMHVRITGNDLSNKIGNLMWLKYTQGIRQHHTLDGLC